MGRSDEELDKRDNKRARAKKARSRRAASTGTASFATVEWLPLVALVIATANEGGAVRLGVTRDGGAFAIGMYVGDDYATEYVKPTEEMSAAIEEIARAWLPGDGADYVAEYQHLLQAQQR